MHHRTDDVLGVVPVKIVIKRLPAGGVRCGEQACGVVHVDFQELNGADHRPWEVTEPGFGRRSGVLVAGGIDGVVLIGSESLLCGRYLRREWPGPLQSVVHGSAEGSRRGIRELGHDLLSLGVQVWAWAIL
ncbi:hypothetical protein GCM10017673_48410 [Streptosporangium violaceochromogenes]|nr:hypothetical protein GCM10017673_48410 [Streptosporangium violaceochromogenes]